MDSMLTKLSTIGKVVFPILKKQPRIRLCPFQITDIAAVHRKSRSPTLEYLRYKKSRKLRNWPSLLREGICNANELPGKVNQDQSKTIQCKPFAKLPDFTNITNLLKTQPNFNWSTLFKQHSQKDLLEWPMYNRSMQFGNPSKLSLKSLLKARLQANHVPILNEKEQEEILAQKYLPDRVKVLGPDMAAVEFFVDRRAAVKLTDRSDWIVGGATPLTAEEQLERCKLCENFFDEECYLSDNHVEAIDCSNFQRNGIRFEGLMYLAELKRLKWLSLRNQKHINVWCLDRVSGFNGNSLEYLDISDCNLDVGCIHALSRMKRLEMLIIKEPRGNIPVKNALSSLQKRNPLLIIKQIKTVYLQQQKVANQSSSS